MIALRPENKIDCGRAPNDLFTLGLRHAASHGDDESAIFRGSGLFQAAQAAKIGIDLFGGFLADMASIEDDEGGILGRGGFDIVMGRQSIRHATRVVDVHLTAEGFYVKLAALLHAADISLSHCWRPRMRSAGENPRRNGHFGTARAFTQNPRGLRPEYRYQSRRGHSAIAAPA